jgi:Ran GTPase-activating protein (RanGAP) involved in mRNA processing and transport
MTSELATRSAIAFLALLVGAGCGGPPAPATQADSAPASAQTSAPTGLAGAATDTVWLNTDKKTLAIDAALSLDQLKARLTKDALAGVTHLVVSGLGLGPDLASVILASNATGELLALDVSDNDLGPRGARTLALASGLGKLQELDLGGNDIGDEGARSLSSTKLRLKSLNLSGNGITGAGVRSLGSGALLSGLSSLDLTMNSIQADGAQALANVPFGDLKFLFLLGCEVGTEGAESLAASQALKSLTVLALSGNSVGDRGAAAIAESPHLTGLTLLDLGANGIGNKGAIAIAKSPTLETLKSLELSGNDVGAPAEAKLKARFQERLKL